MSFIPEDEFIEYATWNKRNPIEKRRADLVDFKKDPVPSKVCFTVPEFVLEYIFANF